MLERLARALGNGEEKDEGSAKHRAKRAERPSSGRLLLARRSVSAAFLDDLLGPDGQGAVGQLTPGQLVHGQNTVAGDTDAWHHWREGADPCCIRSLTHRSGLSLVETLIKTADATGDRRLTHSADGPPYFGDVADFVSYTWHGTSCGELWRTLKTRAMCDDPTGVDELFHWIDVFAVAQNAGANNSEDLDFPQVIKAARRVVAVASPWAHPLMLRRCWCLFELHTIYMSRSPLVVAVPPWEADKLKPRAIAANFDSILSTIVASVDMQRAEAGREEDRTRILGKIKDTCGFDKLTIDVLTLLNNWLRTKCTPEYRDIM